MMCEECYLTTADSLDMAYFCGSCFEKVHAQLKESDHACDELVPYKPSPGCNYSNSRVCLELASVLCIESSHYVSFVRIGTDADSRWIFFDSMSDREGEAFGYSIPEIRPCPNFEEWLDERKLNNSLHFLGSDGFACPDFLRLVKDCYICFYVWPDGLLYS
ncbi:unnamed protein product [Soboliphyme baturini]|uniref:USP domain-containing protein n=1 Tax=Soboliphyme baturini TaxID=241478 RepID=A0A183J260_9BILA|nr:unnamed protein product [Soboliphyme baturini]